MTTKPEQWDALRYEAFLLGEEWQQTRSEAMLRARGVCEVCLRRPAAHVHHLYYGRLGREQPDDLAAVCARCHHLAPSHPGWDDQEQARALWEVEARLSRHGLT